jgi:hypothetical protein
MTLSLVDRYLRAARDHLPRSQQDDIINELSDSIRSRIEDEEAALGRPLDEAEEISMLRGLVARSWWRRGIPATSDR